MAADLRGTARTLCMGFFYKGSQMALPWATPFTYGQADTPVSCSGWESVNPSGLYDGHLLSSAWRIMCTPSSTPCVVRGQALAMGRYPHGKPAAQDMWLWWQWLLLCQLYAFFRPLICKPLLVPLHLHKCFSRGGYRASRWAAPQQRREHGRARGSSSKVQQALTTICPSCLQSTRFQLKTPGEDVLPSDAFHQHSHSFSKHLCLLPAVPLNSPVTTHSPAGCLALCTWSKIRQWFSDTRCRLGHILLSLFTVNCAVGSYSPREINGMMNTN